MRFTGLHEILLKVKDLHRKFYEGLPTSKGTYSAEMIIALFLVLKHFLVCRPLIYFSLFLGLILVFLMDSCRFSTLAVFPGGRYEYKYSTFKLCLYFVHH